MVPPNPKGVFSRSIASRRKKVRHFVDLRERYIHRNAENHVFKKIFLKGPIRPKCRRQSTENLISIIFIAWARAENDGMTVYIEKYYTQDTIFDIFIKFIKNIKNIKMVTLVRTIGLVLFCLFFF